jgi:hypothetical protein
MRDLMKKPDDDLLIVHKANAAPGGPLGPEIANLPADADLLAARLRASGDPAQRSRLIAAIQGQFGNTFAERVIAAARGPAAPPSSGPGPGETPP